MPGGQGSKPGVYRGPHPRLAGAGDRHISLAERALKEGSGIILGTGINADRQICRPGLTSQRGQGPGEIVTAVVCDHNGSDVYFLKN